MKSILMALVIALALTVPAFASDHAKSEMTPPPGVEKSAAAKAEKSQKSEMKKAHKAKKAKKAKNAKHHAKQEGMKSEHGEELKIGPVPKVND